MSKAERQKIHLEMFGSNCECEACVKDYPHLLLLPFADDDDKLSHIMHTFGPFGETDEMLVEYRKNCTLIEKFSDQRPSQELIALFSRNHAILRKLANSTQSFGQLTK